MELRLIIINSLVNTAPSLIVWVVAVIISSLLMKRGGSRPERLLIIGSSLLLVNSFLSIFHPLLTINSLIQRGMSNVGAAGILSGINVFLGLIRLAGIVCLFYAIWKKFNTRASIITDN